MRKRFQKPKIRNKGGYWIAQYRDLEGRKRKVSLGPVAKTKKFDAEKTLAAKLEPINAQSADPTSELNLGAFVRQVYLPFYRRKWKASTAACNEARIGLYLLREFEACPLRTFSRDRLQRYLDGKANEGFSHSVVSHLRWDLRQMFRMAVAEGYLLRNPAELLFVPREAKRYPKPRLTLDQVTLLFSVLDLRERVIAGLATLAGMRPGEIFALRRSHVEDGYVDIRQGIYRGVTDTPKTFNSTRWAALGEGLSNWLRLWLEMLPLTEPDALLFPSERGTTPLRNDNCWKRYFLPHLKPIGLDWANFQVMRRTHATLMDDLGVDPQVRADQMGHTVDVNQNQYTRSSLERRRTAVNALEKALGVA
jgi:integrase